MAEQTIAATFEDKDVADFLKNLKARLKEVDGGEKKFLGLLSVIVFADIMDHFKAEQGPEGPWAAWSEPYEEYMQSIGRGANQILQFSGRLRQNFKPTNVRNTSDGILWFNDARTQEGFPYAAAHDEGGKRLPARPFMWLSERAVEDISKQTLAFMLEEGVA